MKFFVLSDNTDTYLGMRLAGMEGAVVHGRTEAMQKVREVISRDDIGILLITGKLMDMCDEELSELKSTLRRPIITRISDRGGESITKGLEKYVHESLGIKM